MTHPLRGELSQEIRTLDVDIDQPIKTFLGRAQDVRVLKSSGHSRLDEAAVSAVKRWLFKPATQDAHAVQAWTQVAVVFRLDS